MPGRTTKTKAQAAATLRIAGSTFEDIATALGFADADAASRACDKALAEATTGEERSRHRQLANVRLDRLLHSMWDKAVDPEDAEHLAYAREAGKVIDRIVTLNGAAEPAEVIVRTPTTAAIMDWVSRMTASQLPDVTEQDVFAVESGNTIEAEVVEDDPFDAPSQQNDQATTAPLGVQFSHEDQA